MKSRAWRANIDMAEGSEEAVFHLESKLSQLAEEKTRRLRGLLTELSAGSIDTVGRLIIVHNEIM